MELVGMVGWLVGWLVR